MKTIATFGLLFFTSATASAQGWSQHNLDIVPLCGGSGTIFDWTLEYEMDATEVICMGGCDTTAWVDVWDYNAGGSATLLCSVQVDVTADDGSGTCFTPILYGFGSFSCDLSASYGGFEGDELELYFVMETEIPGSCGNPYWASDTLALPACTGEPPPPTTSIDCFGSSCTTYPDPLPDNALATTTWDPCSGMAFDWTASGDFESGSDRFCVGGIATAGSSGGCSTGTELTGTGPFNGTAAGSITLSLATDASQTSPGLTTLSATCQGGTTAEVYCSGLRCTTTPTPLPDDTLAQTNWNPCAGGVFSFSATADLESGYDRVCVGGIASAGPGGGCTAGTELTGTGPFLGNATGSVIVSVATDASTPSNGLTELVAVCMTMPPPVLTGSIRCAGATCTTTPTPLPNDVTSSTNWDPCAGAGFEYTGTGQLEDGVDRGCLGGVATAGTTGGCSAGTELTGSGPWSGQSPGPAIVSIATDDSISSQGLTLQMTRCSTPIGGANVDLVVTPGGITDATRAGRKLRIIYEVENSGTSMAPATATEIRLMPDGAGDGYDLCRDRVDVLSPASRTQRTLECLIPAEVEAGFWQLVVTVDGDNLVPEISETNNRFMKSLTIMSDAAPPATVLPTDEGGCTCITTQRSWSTLLALFAGLGLVRRRSVGRGR